MIETEQQIERAKEKIGAELSTLIANLRSRVGSLQNIKREYETRLETLPQAELELANLTRQTRFNEEYTHCSSKNRKRRACRLPAPSATRW